MAFEPIFQPLGFQNLIVKNRVSRPTAYGVDHDEDARCRSRESMIAEMLSVFSPPPFVRQPPGEHEDGRRFD